MRHNVMHIAKVLLVNLMLIAFPSAWAGDKPDPDLRGTSEPNGLVVSIYSKLTPIPINQIHSWLIHVNTQNGDPVDDAVIKVNGGMPEHNHGLPTSPQITRNLGNGEYLLEGMKFHMNGHWQITVSISHDDAEDAVTFDMAL